MAEELALAQQQAGRTATVMTTPLGDSGFGKSVKTTAIGGF